MPCPKPTGRLGCVECGILDEMPFFCPTCGQTYCQSHASTMRGCTFDRAAVEAEAAAKSETDPGER